MPITQDQHINILKAGIEYRNYARDIFKKLLQLEKPFLEDETYTKQQVFWLLKDLVLSTLPDNKLSDLLSEEYGKYDNSRVGRNTAAKMAQKRYRQRLKLQEALSAEEIADYEMKQGLRKQGFEADIEDLQEKITKSGPLEKEKNSFTFMQRINYPNDNRTEEEKQWFVAWRIATNPLEFNVRGHEPGKFGDKIRLCYKHWKVVQGIEAPAPTAQPYTNEVTAQPPPPPGIPSLEDLNKPAEIGDIF